MGTYEMTSVPKSAKFNPFPGYREKCIINASIASLSVQKGSMGSSLAHVHLISLFTFHVDLKKSEQNTSPGLGSFVSNKSLFNICPLAYSLQSA
jgi:hypothetical protein